MYSLKLFASNELDYDEYSNLQKIAFENVLKKYEVSSDYMTSEYYSWKYSPPSGNAIIAAIYEKSMMVSTAAAIPLIVVNGESKIIGWRCFDVVTLPAARGKGYFYKCLSSLKTTLAPDQIFFGYPNKFSVRGFEKIGCQKNETVDYWIKPVLMLKKTKSILPEIRSFDEIQELISKDFFQNNKTTIQRDLSYLGWRYCKHPIYNYKIFISRNNNKCQGIVVVRKSKIFNRDFLLILEFWSKSRAADRGLISMVHNYARENKVNFIVSINNYFKSRLIQRNGFFRIPFFLMPKKQVLRGFTTGGIAEKVFQSRWIVQMGDLFEF